MAGWGATGGTLTGTATRFTIPLTSEEAPEGLPCKASDYRLLKRSPLIATGWRGCHQADKTLHAPKRIGLWRIPCLLTLMRDKPRPSGRGRIARTGEASARGA